MQIKLRGKCINNTITHATLFYAEQVLPMIIKFHIKEERLIGQTALRKSCIYLAKHGQGVTKYQWPFTQKKM